LLAPTLNRFEQATARNGIEARHAAAQERQRIGEARFTEVADPAVKQPQQGFVLQEDLRSSTQKAFQESSRLFWLT
jgi:hypothetical protein